MTADGPHPYQAEADAEHPSHYHCSIRVHRNGVTMSVAVLRYAWWNAARPGLERHRRDWARRHIIGAIARAWREFDLPWSEPADWAEVQAWIQQDTAPQFRRSPSAIYRVQRLADWPVELCLTDEMVLRSPTREEYQRGITRRFRAGCRAKYNRDPGYSEFRQLSLEWLRYAS